MNCYQAALAIDPKNAAAQFQLDRLLGQLGDFHGAEAAFRRALEAEPEFAEAHYHLGLTFVADPRGGMDWQGAIAEFRAAVKSRPNYPEALNMIGVGLMNSGNTDAAIKALQQATHSDAKSPEIHFNLGLAFDAAEQPAAAESEYRSALKLKPAYGAVAIALGKLLSKQGKNTAALEYLRAVLQLNPDTPSGHYVLATVLRAQGSAETAKTEFAIAAQLTGRQSMAVQAARLSNAGLDLAAKGDFPGAVTAARERSNSNPTTPLFISTLGFCWPIRGT